MTNQEKKVLNLVNDEIKNAKEIGLNNKEIADLIKKNKQLQDEVDILKKAMVIFTKK